MQYTCPVLLSLQRLLCELLPHKVKGKLNNIIGKCGVEDLYVSIKGCKSSTTAYHVMREEEIIGVIEVPPENIRLIMVLFLETVSNKEKEPRECLCCRSWPGSCLCDEVSKTLTLVS